MRTPRFALAFALVFAILLSAFPSGAQAAPQAQLPSASVSPNEPNAKIVIPAGTSVPLAVTRPLFSKNAKPGDSIYAETAFPLTVNNQIAIPTGTLVQGQIDTLTKPGWLSPHAHIQIHFTKLIFAGGYAVSFPGTYDRAAEASFQQTASVVTGSRRARPQDVLAAVSDSYVDVTSSNDLLLDNGSQITMLLQLPLRLPAAAVDEAVSRTSPGPLPKFTSATQCRPTSGTPGTSDTVIPGSPGTPGTPDIVIPGAPGTPDIVVPGIPATSGTPDTIIPGSPSFPGTACPAPPIVASDLKPQTFKKSLQISIATKLLGSDLPAGRYEVTWEGQGPAISVNFLQNGKKITTVPAKAVLLNSKPPADVPELHTHSDGGVSLRSLRFAGQPFALYFSPPGK